MAYLMILEGWASKETDEMIERLEAALDPAPADPVDRQMQVMAIMALSEGGTRL